MLAAALAADLPSIKAQKNRTLITPDWSFPFPSKTSTCDHPSS